MTKISPSPFAGIPAKWMPLQGTNANCTGRLGDQIKCNATYDGCGVIFDKENGEVQARDCIEFPGKTAKTGCGHFDVGAGIRKYSCICTTDLCNGSTSLKGLFFHIITLGAALVLNHIA